MKIKALILFFILSTILVAISCTKSSVSSNLSPAYLRLINMKVGSQFDMLLDQTSLISVVGYDSATPFINGAPGFYELMVKDHNSGDTVLGGRLTLQSGTYYSLFVVPDSTTGSSKVNTTLVADNHSIPQFDSAKIRFLDFSIGTPTMNIYQIHRRGTSDNYDTLKVISSGRVYLDHTTQASLAQYIPIQATTFYFAFTTSALTNPQQVIPMVPVNLVKDNFYTVCIEGRAGSTNADSLKIRVFNDQ